MYRPRFVRLVLVLIASVLIRGARVADAQPIGYWIESVESAALRSPRIVRVVIERAQVDTLTDPFRQYRTVTARALETLRGEPVEKIRFSHAAHFGRLKAEELVERQWELLLFLAPWERMGVVPRGSTGYNYTRFPEMVVTSMLLEDGRVAWSSSQLSVLDANRKQQLRSNEVLSTIRRYLSSRGPDDPILSNAVD